MVQAATATPPVKAPAPPAKPAKVPRGALATQVVTVVEERGFRTSAGLERKPEDQGTHSEDYLFTLQQERRPPLAGCWMVKEMIMMKHHMIFAGDSGAVNS